MAHNALFLSVVFVMMVFLYHFQLYLPLTYRTSRIIQQLEEETLPLMEEEALLLVAYVGVPSRIRH